MSRPARWLLSLAMLLAISLFALASEQWLMTAVLGFLFVASFLPVRVSVDNFGQIALALFGLAAVWLLVFTLGGSDKGEYPGLLGPLGLLMTPLFLWVAVSRLFLKDAWLGSRGTLAALLVAFFFLGDGKLAFVYPAFSVAGMPVLLLILKLTDPARAELRRPPASAARGAFGVVGLAAATSAVLIIGLPIAHDRAFDWFESAMDKPSTGFSEHLTLGSLKGLIRSDETVLRIHGQRPDYLRGVVYRTYHRGSWLTSGLLGQRQVGRYQWTEPLTGRATEIQTIGGDREHYFVPLRARRISLSVESFRTDELGLVRPMPGGSARVVRFEKGERDFPVVGEPDENDLRMPEALRRDLEDKAHGWIGGARGNAQKLEAIARHLRRQYRYSLDFEIPDNGDPILHFLDQSKRGHCEYFASAMAMLARSAGIPARVVGGYRVSEYNAVGGYYLVRERNAHAWVEAWIPGEGWRTYDPTPPSMEAVTGQIKTGMLSGIIDLISYKAGLAWSRILEMTPGQMAAMVAILSLFWAVYRLVRRLRGRGGKDRMTDFVYRTPSPELKRLFKFLDGRGETRSGNETLESYTRRVAASEKLGPPMAEEASRLLEEYSRLRYGNKGDEKTVFNHISVWLNRVE